MLHRPVLPSNTDTSVKPRPSVSCRIAALASAYSSVGTTPGRALPVPAMVITSSCPECTGMSRQSSV